MEGARDVSIREEGVAAGAEQIAALAPQRPTWKAPPHWWDDTHPERTANYVLLLDALNFSFWGEPRWRVRQQAKTLDGYYGLAAALAAALRGGVPLYEARYLREEARAEVLLAGADGTSIPLLSARQAALQEVGEGLQRWNGSFLGCIAEADGDCASLVRLVLDQFPSFRDVATYQGQPVPLYKRAQILVSDVWGAFDSRGPGAFRNLEALTMFADYKVPQVLNGLGVLAYSSSLERTLLAQEEIPAGDPREVEIRAASVQAIERITGSLAERDLGWRAFEIDWAVWGLGQGRAWPLPYHRTRTVAY